MKILSCKSRTLPRATKYRVLVDAINALNYIINLWKN